MRILVLNAGSSTLKVALVEDGEAIAGQTVDWGADATRATDRRSTVERALSDLAVGPNRPPDVVGHRVVHGGSEFVKPVVVDDEVVSRLRALEPLAPLHNPVAIDTLEAARESLPAVPHVATFDTGFHATLPETVRRYPVPARWVEWGVRRYGFHGLSVEWSVERCAELLGRRAGELRIVVAHLGSGCSVTAVDGGRSVTTSMGMTPLEGLMMGTRAGSIDPGILVRLLRDGRLTLDQLDDELDHASGLVGVTGTTDVAALEAAAAAGDPTATLGLAMFAERAAAGIAAAATALSALDAIVFTGGIGEHAAPTRSQIVARLAVLGVEALPPGPVDDDAILGDLRAPVAVLRIAAREDLVIARHAQRLIDSRGQPA